MKVFAKKLVLIVMAIVWLVPALGQVRVTRITELNRSAEAVGSHADEWRRSLLEMDFRRSVVLDSTVLGITTANYPRIKRTAAGDWLLFYQTNKLGRDIHYARSRDLMHWEEEGRLFESFPTRNGSDVRLYTTCDAVVLSGGDILAFASFRNRRGYRREPQGNGIVMRRSLDGGHTWEPETIVYVGTNWEPYPLQLPSGEVQVYFTDNEPVKGDSGTSLLRSRDEGRTWRYEGKIIRQNSGMAVDGSGDPIYTDQMASARVLNGSGRIAVALESRFVKEYRLTMAYSDDNWATPLRGNETGPAERRSNIYKGCAPYLVQFPSGETVLSSNEPRRFTLRVGDSEAREFGREYRPFALLGYWGATEIVDSHTLVGTMPAINNTVVPADNRLQVAQFVLNHNVVAPRLSPRVDGRNADWRGVDQALFVGSMTQAQAVFRFAHDRRFVYLLVERSDELLTAGDDVTVWLKGEAAPLRLTIAADDVRGTVKVDNPAVKCGAGVAGRFGERRADGGYVVELAIPKSLLGLSTGRLAFNAELIEEGLHDGLNGLTAENPDEWPAVVLGR